MNYKNIEITELKRKISNDFDLWKIIKSCNIESTEYGNGLVSDIKKKYNIEYEEDEILITCSFKSIKMTWNANNFQINVNSISIPEGLYKILNYQEEEQKQLLISEKTKLIELINLKEEFNKQNKLFKLIAKKLQHNYILYLKYHLNDLFDDYNFSDLKIFLQNNKIDQETSFNIIKDFVSKFISKYNKELSQDNEKISVLSNENKNTLIKARAGSGKTTLIALNTIIQNNFYKIQPKEILLLAFNKNAQVEILERVRNKFKFSDFYQARTFHSLAYRIVRPSEDILLDEGDKFSNQKLYSFITSVVREIWKKYNFSELMYNFFKYDLEDYKFTGGDLNKEDYFFLQRNKAHITLRGDFVKSKGEKFIADFFFEHDIKYIYEPLVSIRQFERKNRNIRIYKPDFLFFYGNKKFYLEHWGIDENDKSMQVPEHWIEGKDPTVVWKGYVDNIHWKREFWNNRKQTLIETSVLDLSKGRDNFEQILKGNLKKHNIQVSKLSHKELVARVVEAHRNRMTDRFIQFINRAKQLSYDIKKVKELCNVDKPTNRIEMFHYLSIKVFEHYELKKQKDNFTDFNDLLLNAFKKIEQFKGEINVELCDKSEGPSINLNDLKFIMIDEYQDFSELFFKIISALKKYNKELKLLCVGDDWQAINGFAGSDIKYFKRFNDYFDNAVVLNMFKNYRSGREIINYSNKISNESFSEYSIPVINNGEVWRVNTDKLFLNLNNSKHYNEQAEDDDKYLFSDRDAFESSRQDICKYLKVCKKIIDTNKNAKSILILNRTNNVGKDVSLKNFEDKLNEIYEKQKDKNIKSKIEVNTSHSSKGKEADIVIILKVVRGNYPLIHPDNELFQIFGKSLNDAVIEERNIFYVSCTRARKKLFLLTEEGLESEFLLVNNPDTYDNNNLI